MGIKGLAAQNEPTDARRRDGARRLYTVDDGDDAYGGHRQLLHVPARLRARRGIRQADLGGRLDGRPPQASAQVAQGQRLPGEGPSAADELVLEVLQFGVPRAHGDREHLDTPAG